ncbi:unnamed protein product, partial [marine sediment metagenome]
IISMILLINPKTTKPTEFQTDFFREPNLGILYLAAILDQNNIPVEILDLEQYYGLEPEELNKIINKSFPGTGGILVVSELFLK